MGAATGEGSKEEELGHGVEGALGEKDGTDVAHRSAGYNERASSPEQKREGAGEDRMKVGSSSKEGSHCRRK